MKLLCCTAGKRALLGLVVFVALTTARANMVVGPWTRLFEGVEHAVGTNIPTTVFTNLSVVYYNSRLQVVHCLRIDLTAPDVQLFTTPPASSPVVNYRETLTLSVSNFVKNYGVKVGANAGFYSGNPGGSDPASEGLACEVYGLHICQGVVVSAPDSGPDANGRYASLLFTTNKQPIFALNNRPPGTNTAGIYTAVSGYYPLLTSGVNIGAASIANYPDGWVHQAQPRTAFGVSQDRRYLYLMTLDGRQGSYSDGSLDVEMGLWLQLFGVWDAISMDGGGSTAMYMADAAGNPVPLNHSSYVAQNGKERYIGTHLGVFTIPVFNTAIAAAASYTTATITWTTLSNATSQVEYGLTTNYGLVSALDSTSVSNHSVALSGLIAGTDYYIRVISTVGSRTYATASKFRTSDFISSVAANPGITNATITWTTASNATTQVEYGLTPSFGLVSTFDATAVTLHSVTLSDLVAATNYFFRVISQFENNEYSLVSTFQTKDFINDVAARPGVTNAIVTWTTFAEASSQVEYGLTPSYGLRSAFDATPVTNHSVVLADLVAGTNYFFRVISKYETNSYSAVSNFLTQDFISTVAANPGATTATITWTTFSEASSRVEYGLTANYGLSSAFDPTPKTNHSVAITDLIPGSNYWFRVISIVGNREYAARSSFRASVTVQGMIYDVTQVFTYATNNLDGINWNGPGYDDASWPRGPGLLWADRRGPNAALPLEATRMPVDPSTTYPFSTYYLRTHFAFTNRLTGSTLTFSNYLDDGAVFYLNGVEINRPFMAPLPTVISNSALSVAYNCTSGDATCPYVFTIAGDLITNLVSGDNVLAVEMHNYKALSPDITFGSALLYTAPAPIPPPPAILQPPANATLSCGDNVTFTVVAQGTPPLNYQWLLNGSALPAATNLLLTVSNATLAQNGNAYRVLVSNVLGSTFSDPAILAVVDAAPPTIFGPSNMVLSADPGQCFKSNVTFSATATDNCSPAPAIVCHPASGSTFFVGVTSVTCAAFDGSGNTNLSSFTVTVQGAELPQVLCPTNLVVSTDQGQCSRSNVIYVVLAAANCPGLGVVCAPPSGSTFSNGVTTVTCTTTDVATNISTCTFTVTVRDLEPPKIVLQPQSRTNLLGSDATFSVAAISCGPFTYQWCQGTNALAGETNATLTITDVKLSHAGDYSVRLANSSGSLKSQIAVLTVNRPPVAFDRGAATIVNQPVRLTRDELLGSDFDPDGDPLNVSVNATSANHGTVSLTSSNVTYVPPSDFLGTDFFSYSITDDRGGVASANVEVLVVSAPLPPPNHVAILPAANGFLVRFAGVPGRAYQIQRSTDLILWTTLDTIAVPLHGILEYDDPDSLSGPVFYRVVLP